jgi:SET domain
MMSVSAHKDAAMREMSHAVLQQLQVLRPLSLAAQQMSEHQEDIQHARAMAPVLLANARVFTRRLQRNVDRVVKPLLPDVFSNAARREQEKQLHEQLAQQQKHRNHIMQLSQSQFGHLPQQRMIPLSNSQSAGTTPLGVKSTSSNGQSVAYQHSSDDQSDQDVIGSADCGDKKNGLPKHWPRHLAYTNITDWSHVQGDLKRARALRSKISEGASWTHVRIEKITDRSHPCFGEYGLFATRDMKKNDYIMDYAGRVVIRAPESCSESRYICELRQQVKYGGKYYNIDVDAVAAGNEARFINDCTGTSNTPNAEFIPYFDGCCGECRIGIHATRDIMKGEELFVPYGEAYWKAVRANNSDSSDGIESVNSDSLSDSD